MTQTEIVAFESFWENCERYWSLDRVEHRLLHRLLHLFLDRLLEKHPCLRGLHIPCTLFGLCTFWIAHGFAGSGVPILQDMCRIIDDTEWVSIESWGTCVGIFFCDALPDTDPRSEATRQRLFSGFQTMYFLEVSDSLFDFTLETEACDRMGFIKKRSLVKGCGPRRP